MCIYLIVLHSNIWAFSTSPFDCTKRKMKEKKRKLHKPSSEEIYRRCVALKTA